MVAQNQLVVDPASFPDLKVIMDDLRFEPKDALTLALISSNLRIIAPGAWNLLRFINISSPVKDCLLLEFPNVEDRIMWQLSNIM